MFSSKQAFKKKHIIVQRAVFIPCAGSQIDDAEPGGTVAKELIL